MGYQPVEGIKFDLSADTKSPTARISRGAKIAAQGPKSPIYQQVPVVQSSVDDVAAETQALQKLVDDHSAALGALAKARTALRAGLARWDRTFHVLVANGERHCATTDDGTGLGMTVRGTTKHALQVPLSIELTYDPRKKQLRIHVTRAPGARAVAVEIGTGPTAPASWQELPGNGAVHVIPNPAPGTSWVRAASKTARAKSDFTTPVSIIIP